MVVYLIRHHATLGNKEKRYVGTTDEDLMEESVQELELIAQQSFWQDRKFPKVFVSPLKRCVQTAEILFPEAKLIPVENLKECDFGQFEYKNYQELNGNPEYQRFIDTLGACGFPDGETKNVFQKRCSEAFMQIVKENSKEEIVVFVIHGGTIMSILDSFSNPHQDYYSWQLKNAEGYVMNLEWIKENLVCSNIRKMTLSEF